MQGTGGTGKKRLICSVMGSVLAFRCRLRDLEKHVHFAFAGLKIARQNQPEALSALSCLFWCFCVFGSFDSSILSMIYDIRPSLRSRGTNRAVSPTTSNDAVPPSTTAGTAPSSRAATPDSNAPSSFELPMNTEFTADTRPSISGGVRS